MRTTEDASFTLDELLAQRSWARRLARRLVGTAADADDLVQEGLLAGLVARPADRGGLRPWLATVLGRAAAKRRRADRRRQARELAEGQAHAARAVVPSPEALVAQFEGQRLLADLVLALEPAVREVVLLRFHQDLTSVEIARALGIPEGTARWRLKLGLDELRGRLDDRHGGRREAWVAALAPIAVERGPEGRGAVDPRDAGGGAHSARGRAWWPALAAGAALVVGATWLVVSATTAGRSPGAQDGDGAAGQAPAADRRPPGDRGEGGGRGRRDGRVPQLAAAATPEACGVRLQEVRALQQARAVEFMDTARIHAPAVLFELGAVNPAGEAALDPLLARILEASADRPAGHTLSCRALVCQLRVLVSTGALSYDWEEALQRDPELRERARGFSRASGRTLQDPLTAASQREETYYLPLWTLDAAPTMTRLRTLGPPALPPLVSLVPSGPPPADLDRCRAELVEAERRLRTMIEVIERSPPPERRWERSAPDPALTGERDALARKILGLPADAPAITVACRADVCRVDFDRQAFPGPNDWKRLFTPEWRRGVGPMSLGAWTSHFVIEPRDATGGRELINRLHGELLASPGLRDCEAGLSPAGQLDLELVVPAGGQPAWNGEAGKIGWRTGGPLWSTRFARCFEAELAGLLARTPLPAKVTGAKVQRRFSFPRPAPGGGASGAQPPSPGG
jgi:RNA polymerase sigma factor (sigma-70 family)